MNSFERRFALLRAVRAIGYIHCADPAPRFTPFDRCTREGKKAEAAWWDAGKEKKAGSAIGRVYLGLRA